MPRNIVTNWDDVPIIMDINMAARIVGQAYETVKKKCQRGEFPAFKQGREWRVEKEMLQEYIRKNCVMVIK